MGAKSLDVLVAGIGTDYDGDGAESGARRGGRGGGVYDPWSGGGATGVLRGELNGWRRDICCDDLF